MSCLGGSVGAEVHADGMFDDVHNKLPRSVMLELDRALVCGIFTFMDYDKHILVSCPCFIPSYAVSVY